MSYLTNFTVTNSSQKLIYVRGTIRFGLLMMILTKQHFEQLTDISNFWWCHSVLLMLLLHFKVPWMNCSGRFYANLFSFSLMTFWFIANHLWITWITFSMSCTYYSLISFLQSHQSVYLEFPKCHFWVMLLMLMDYMLNQTKFVLLWTGHYPIRIWIAWVSRLNGLLSMICKGICCYFNSSHRFIKFGFFSMES